MKLSPHLLLLFILLTVALIGCRQLSTGDESREATVAALGAMAELTSTAQAQATSLSATKAAQPQETPTSEPTATEAVREVTATPDAAATQAVSGAATTTALAPVLAELPTYGVEPDNGELAWIHPPVTIQASGYMSYTYANQNVATVAKDFVLAADITWNTRFGTAGCGYVLRSDGDQEGNYDQYIALLIRGGSGELLFSIIEDGELRSNEITNIDANRFDPLFEWQNDTTNRFVVVGRGDTFSFYSNGTHIGEVTPSVLYERGFVAFVGLNESGTTTCQYDNAWLWLME